MASTSPVEIGARGTIGSLVLQEIEYFKKLDLDGQRSSHQRPKMQMIDGGGASGSSSCSNTRHGFGSRSYAGKKMRATGSGGLFLPSICAAVEIAGDGWADRTPRTGYRNLKDEQG